MAMENVTGAAANAESRSNIIVPLIQHIDDVIRLDGNSRIFEQADLNGMKSLLQDMASQFQDQENRLPDTVKECLQKTRGAVEKARQLFVKWQRRQPCIDYFLCRPKLSTQIKDWVTTFDELFHQLQRASVSCNSEQLVVSPRHEDTHTCYEPEFGLIGSRFSSARMELEMWLTETPHVNVIGVYGIAGVGKTTLLQKVYNAFKVSNVFEVVIWVTVTQFPILEFHDIAQKIKLDLASSSDVEGEIVLTAYLKTKKFLLILDDMWSGLNLKELGVSFDKGSKVVFSTRNRDLIGEMNAEKSLQIQPLSTDEAWDLFSKVAFKNGHVPEEIEDIARQVAGHCRGLPLTIISIAAAMIGSINSHWYFAFDLMQIPTLDFNFSITHSRLDRDLYDRLKWAFNSLSAKLKNCIMYCAMFPEDWKIDGQILENMWVAEGLVRSKEAAYLMQRENSCIKLLEDRCLLKVDLCTRCRIFKLRSHDVVRDMAIFIGERYENCLLRAGQTLQHFPEIEIKQDWKRISVYGNDIESLPERELRCSEIVSLILTGNRRLREVPEAFLHNLTSLRVLDLSETQIESLPTTLWQLKQLAFLNLSSTEIEEIPEGIGNLSGLKFLYLNGCWKLKALSSHIGELKILKYLDIRLCKNLKMIPHELAMMSKCEIAHEY